MNMIQTMKQLPSMKTQLIFDLESTGLLRQGSTIHCLVMRDDLNDTHVYDCRPDQTILQGVKRLEQADVLIGHNIIGYDIPLIKEQFPDFNPQGQAIEREGLTIPTWSNHVMFSGTNDLLLLNDLSTWIRSNSNRI